MLPILTFDERSLSPAYGYVFDPKWVDPHESIVSILWKFARMNALPGHVVAAQVALDCVDPYEGVEPTREAVDARRLRRILRLPMKFLRGGLIPPYLRKITSPYFRYCTACLGCGYHATLYQLETLARCPIHRRVWLKVKCRHCGEPSPYRLDARLLDAPFRCANCRRPYGFKKPAFVQRPPFPHDANITMTPLRLRYHWL